MCDHCNRDHDRELRDQAALGPTLPPDEAPTPPPITRARTGTYVPSAEEIAESDAFQRLSVNRRKVTGEPPLTEDSPDDVIVSTTHYKYPPVPPTGTSEAMQSAFERQVASEETPRPYVYHTVKEMPVSEPERATKEFPPIKRPRASWDEYFMAIAVQVATRATCDRKHVGAVIVKNRTILSTGYNGAPRGLPHCDDVGHEMKDMGGRQSCVRTAHAEANAIAQAARTGTSCEGAMIYTTASPCYDCFKLILNTGITRIVCLEFYASRYGVSGDVEELANTAQVEMVFLKKDVSTP